MTVSVLNSDKFEAYEIYGFRNPEISASKKILNNLLSLDFIEHESEFYGVYYLSKKNNGETYKLYLNYFDNEYHEEDYKDFPVLLGIDKVSTTSSLLDLIRKNIIDATPIRRCEINEVEAKAFKFDNLNPVLIKTRKLI